MLQSATLKKGKKRQRKGVHGGLPHGANHSGSYDHPIPTRQLACKSHGTLPRVRLLSSLLR